MRVLDVNGEEILVGANVKHETGYEGFVEALGRVGETVVAEVGWPGLKVLYAAYRPDRYLPASDLTIINQGGDDA